MSDIQRKINVLHKLTNNGKNKFIRSKKIYPYRVAWSFENKGYKLLVRYQIKHGMKVMSDAYWYFYNWKGVLYLDHGYSIKEFNRLYNKTIVNNEIEYERAANTSKENQTA